jgi:putative membrane-bound dehydrogenase-like protein
MPNPIARLMPIFIAVVVCCVDFAIAAGPRTSVDKAATAEKPAARERAAAVAEQTKVQQPTAVDKRLAIELFAVEPQIVTPTGIAVDGHGRVLVIESHTHFRPENYQGPAADRIRLFEDTDGDGRADRISTFFEGTQYTMNLAIDHEGGVYVATRNLVLRLRDTDGDGRADQRTEIARLETLGNYPHNGLSGFAFDFADNVYFGLGENLGADYRLVGSDGAAISGGGEGGSIYRCRPDGGGLHRVATGFWNPFHVCLDAFGRLFAVDNDPDSRPPCRLLHIIDGGDYGYRYRNGRKGVHPFTAWNGELPGTLPMTAGTGEAPSGVLAYESDGLPGDYRGALLATSWGDHRIERFDLEPRGASFRATAEPIVAGGENFRPVGIALAPDGSLYVSDWVDKSYTLHGKGRVWHIRGVEQSQPKPSGRQQTRLPPGDPRQGLVSAHRPWREQAARELAAKDDTGRAFLRSTLKDHADPHVRAVALAALVAAGASDERVRKTALADASTDVRALAARILPGRNAIAQAMAERQPPEVRAEGMRRCDDASARPALIKALASDDPFVRQAARQGLKQTSDVAALVADSGLQDPKQRLEIVLVLRESSDPAARAVLPRLLSDPDPVIRFAAVQWVGERRLVEFRPQLESGLAHGATTRDLFEAYLAALECLDGVHRDPKDESSGEEYVLRVLLATQTPPDVRARALRMLRPDHPALSGKLAGFIGAKNDERVRLEAIRTLRERTGNEAGKLLAEVAGDTHASLQLRAEAVVGLSPRDAQHRGLLFELATGDEPALRDEALRSLRGADLSAEERRRLDVLVSGPASVQELLARTMPNGAGGKPDGGAKSVAADRTQWLKLLEGQADARAGERIYFHPSGPGCYRCHQIDGRGGRIGPDLSNVARVLSRERLVESLLEPSKEVAPQFVSYSVERTDGTVFSGVLVSEDAVGENASGQRTYADAQGKLISIPVAQIARSRPQRTSIMPEGLLNTMTHEEFRDLVAYLAAPR